MTASEMAKKANENRRKRLGEKGYSKYMKEVVRKRIEKQKDGVDNSLKP